MNAPIAAPEAEAIQSPPERLADCSIEEYLKMVEKCIPIQKSEYLALLFMRAEIKRAGDVQVLKGQFMKAAGRLDSDAPLPPMTDAALRVIAAPKLRKKGH